MDQVFDEHFGPSGPFPLREPTKLESDEFYALSEQQTLHAAMGALIAKISGVAPEKVDALPITVQRRGQAYLVSFLNAVPETHTDPAPHYLIRLNKPITTLNGQEVWDEVNLREPNFAEVGKFYLDKEQHNERVAMLNLMTVLSGINRFALGTMPLSKFREGQAYLLGFLTYFPTWPTGGKLSRT